MSHYVEHRRIAYQNLLNDLRQISQFGIKLERTLWASYCLTLSNTVSPIITGLDNEMGLRF
jgi:hypothetical protein